MIECMHCGLPLEAQCERCCEIIRLGYDPDSKKLIDQIDELQSENIWLKEMLDKKTAEEDVVVITKSLANLNGFREDIERLQLKVAHLYLKLKPFAAAWEHACDGDEVTAEAKHFEAAHKLLSEKTLFGAKEVSVRILGGVDWDGDCG